MKKLKIGYMNYSSPMYLLSSNEKKERDEHKPKIIEKNVLKNSEKCRVLSCI